MSALSPECALRWAKVTVGMVDIDLVGEIQQNISTALWRLSGLGSSIFGMPLLVRLGQGPEIGDRQGSIV